jgi:hypothetical protein
MVPSPDGVASLRLYLDLGDVFTKTLAVRDRSRRARFPSVIAHALLDEAPAADRLLLYSETPMQRLAGYDPSRHSRLRSYPGGEEKLRAARDRGHPAAGARFAGRLAVLYGADRMTLGESCTEESVDALVHKALLKTARGCRDVEIVYVVDEGVKSASIERYASDPRTIEMLRWTLERPDPEPMRLDVTGRVVDAADCVAAVLPEELAVAAAGRLLVVDIGYTRTKLAVITPDGCERQAQVSLGFSDCVRRVLRDGQDQGLVEDEFAVIWALERSRRIITVAGRRFDVGAMLRTAASAAVVELGRAVQRVVRPASAKSSPRSSGHSSWAWRRSGSARTRATCSSTARALSTTRALRVRERSRLHLCVITPRAGRRAPGACGGS